MMRKKMRCTATGLCLIILGFMIPVATRAFSMLPTVASHHLGIDTSIGGPTTSSSTCFLASTNGKIDESSWVSRRNFLLSTAGSVFVAAAPPSHALPSSYSANARNMERLASGDSSGGSVYDNNPQTERGRKRRAMTGCKIPSAREEASVNLGKTSLSEKDCNLKVMDGDAEFMLEAMRNLECESCPYGVNPNR